MAEPVAETTLMMIVKITLMKKSRQLFTHISAKGWVREIIASILFNNNKALDG